MELDKSAAETLCRSLSTVPVFQLVGVTAYNRRSKV